ncbi:DUF3095 domain-containing protein [Cellulophaga sp. 20_2_10]|uniref:DUF3095 family protein n=1 Tax=Cellulophaga sp. 20_2_10 TaxID=2942476 RepID=UPI00201ADC51|nr:DUF3095 family protein [Cellulophaga sp. 20_2_10]MCL5245645.1 DUF3095 domain-containing protein [Cellulophaga sp. 20_2_10]
MESTLFYNNLINYKKPVTELLSKTDLFKRIPDEWYIIVTDIKGSTASVEKGLSEIVNLIATGSIIASLNIAKKHTIDIPFFFGGDGATLLIPPILLQETMEALVLYQKNIKKEFNINLRVGNMPISNVYKNKQELKIIKVRINKLHTIPVVLGNGLLFAEKIIKSKDVDFTIPNKQDVNLDLEGMECRWNKIAPPQNSNEVVSLLINSISESKQAFNFQKILEKTDEIYGSLSNRNPISIDKLELKFNFKKIKTELKASNKKIGIINFLKVWVNGVIGKYVYLPNQKGQKYLNELKQLSDILVMDGRINMVITGSPKQRQLLTEYLDDLEKNGLIVYGIHVSKRSIMSCYVQNRSEKHIHFIDGGNSGYTRAAMVLKEKYKINI